MELPRAVCARTRRPMGNRRDLAGIFWIARTRVTWRGAICTSFSANGRRFTGNSGAGCYRAFGAPMLEAQNESGGENPPAAPRAPARNHWPVSGCRSTIGGGRLTLNNGARSVTMHAGERSTQWCQLHYVRQGAVEAIEWICFLLNRRVFARYRPATVSQTIRVSDLDRKGWLNVGCDRRQKA